jgi:hypothetical protein
MTVDVREIPLGGDLKPFLDVVDTIYKDDPSYVRPLDLDVKSRLARKHPYFAHSEGTNFVAYYRGRPAGRLTAHINRLHLDRYKDDTGFFGFFDTVDDAAVAKALIDRAAEWLGARGIKKIRGPLTLNMAEEVGCLVEGFDTPPMLLMPHHRWYQGNLIEHAGLTGIRDFYAWRYTVGNVPPRALRGHESISKLPEVTVRQVDMKHLKRDVMTLLDIYQDAWDDSWGFVQLTREEAEKAGEDMKLIAIPELTRIVDIDGEPAAMAYALPNINEMIGDLHGKVFPIGLPKLLYRLKVKGPVTARLVGLGIKKKFRNVRKYAGLSAYLYTEMNRAGADIGLKWGELSYTDEANGPMNVGIKLMGGQIYKRYRLYERAV